MLEDNGLDILELGMDENDNNGGFKDNFDGDYKLKVDRLDELI